MKNLPEVDSQWRKSSFSAQQTDCVEVAWMRGVRDTKHGKAALLIDPAGLVAAVKTDRITR